MIRTRHHLTGKNWNDLMERIEEGCNTIHFLNEPERNGVSPSEAISLWRLQMLPLRESYHIRLIGPTVASDDQGTEWFNEFYGALGRGEYPDLLGLHFYTSEATSAETEVLNAKSYIGAKHNSFLLNEIPVVISEIGSISRDSAAVAMFTTEMMAYMDGEPWISQYGFFGASRLPSDGFVSPAAQLLNADGSLSALGRTYTGVGQVKEGT
jgi:hypothetical protein